MYEMGFEPTEGFDKVPPIHIKYDGIIVTHVRHNSPASRGGIMLGDVVIEFWHNEVTDSTEEAWVQVQVGTLSTIDCLKLFVRNFSSIMLVVMSPDVNIVQKGMDFFSGGAFSFPLFSSARTQKLQTFSSSI